MEHWRREVKAQYEWSRKGKKYKTKYFSALGALLGSKDGKDSQGEGEDTHGSARTGAICDVAKETGGKGIC